MTRGKIRIIGHRRRREGRTDYRQRLALLKSGRPRLVVRRTLNSMTCQIVKHGKGGDVTLVSVTPRDLEGFGWKGGRGNLPSAYLTGMLCGIEARKKGVKEAVMDIGLQTTTKGSRIYSCLKGAVDSGLDLPYSEEVLPPIERIRGLHIEEYSKSGGKLAGISGMFDDVKKMLSEGKPAAKKASGKKTVQKRMKKAEGKGKRPVTLKPAKKK